MNWGNFARHSPALREIFLMILPDLSPPKLCLTSLPSFVRNHSKKSKKIKLKHALNSVLTEKVGFHCLHWVDD